MCASARACRALQRWRRRRLGARAMHSGRRAGQTKAPRRRALRLRPRPFRVWRARTRVARRRDAAPAAAAGRGLASVCAVCGKAHHGRHVLARVPSHLSHGVEVRAQPRRAAQRAFPSEQRAQRLPPRGPTQRPAARPNHPETSAPLRCARSLAQGWRVFIAPSRRPVRSRGGGLEARSGYQNMGALKKDARNIAVGVGRGEACGSFCARCSGASGDG